MAPWQHVLFLAEDYRLEQCPVPEVGQQEVLVRVLAVGICMCWRLQVLCWSAYFWSRLVWVWQYACGCDSMHVGVAVCL